MKTRTGLLFPGMVMITLLNVACATGASLHERDTREAVETMFDQGWNRGNTGVFAELIADDVLFHYAGASRRYTREEMSRIVHRWREAFPDLRMKVDQLIVQGDLAAARLTFSGTHQGTWLGFEATGRPARMALMMFFRFEDGRMVELWESDDQLGLRQQLGVIH